jgi:choline transport protein
MVAACVLLYRRVGKGFKDPDPSAKPCLAEGPDGEVSIAWGPWHLPGMFGVINNILAIMFLIIVWFFAFWPPMAETTGENMNWAVLMTGSIMLFSTAYYFLRANKQYQGPIFEVRF